MLPAGLDKKDPNRVEIFTKNGNAMALYRGRCISFFELPAYIINIFRREMLSIPNRVRNLGLDKIEDENERLHEYVKADYGRFDNEADFDSGITKKEVCEQEAIEAFNISPREVDILKLIAEGKKVPEIAEILFISPKTAETHTNNIKRKLKLYTPVALTHFAIKHKIISL